MTLLPPLPPQIPHHVPSQVSPPISAPVSQQAPSERHALFAFPYDFDRFRPGFLAAYLQKSRRLARTAALIQPALRVAGLAMGPRSSSRVAFLGTRFEALIAALPDLSPVVLGTAGDLSVCWRLRLPFRPVHHIHGAVYDLWRRDPQLQSAAAARLIRQTAAVIARSTSQWLVMENDSLFRQRFMVMCAREAGIRTLCIQDGLFQGQTPPETWHGHFADIMAVWGEGAMAQFVAAGFAPQRLRVLGYPHAIGTAIGKGPPAPAPAPVPALALPPRRVCILGQDWANYDPALERLKRELLGSAARYLVAAGLELGYKPHPKEDRHGFLPPGAERVEGDLGQALPHWDAFISLSSTALLDATLAGRVALQIHHQAFSADRFDDAGYAYRIDHRDLADLPALLHTFAGPFPVPAAVVRLAPDLGERFRRLLDDLG